MPDVPLLYFISENICLVIKKHIVERNVTYIMLKNKGIVHQFGNLKKYILSCMVRNKSKFTTIFIWLYAGGSGFGGLGVACWPLVPKFAGSNLAEAVGILRAKNYS